MDLDYTNYLQFVLALIFVIGLIGLVALVMRYFGLGGAIRLGKHLGPTRRRIEVVEYTPIDSRRRLILVRRDDTEHLILLGNPDDIVIESGIIPPEEALASSETMPGTGRIERPNFKTFVSSLRSGQK